MTDFGEKINRFYVQLSLKLYVIETNQFFLQIKWATKIKVRYEKGTHWDLQKWGSVAQKLLSLFKYGSTWPTLASYMVDFLPEGS